MNPHAPSVPALPAPAPVDAAAEVLSTAADAAAARDPLEEVLRQIAGGHLVLTDGQGAVSKWSETAELLFGRPAEEVLGRSFFGTVTGGPQSPEADAWRRCLEDATPPRAPGRVTLTALHADGRRFALEALFVPVSLDEGFDFSLFLEDLGLELPTSLMIARVRQQHPVVVRALGRALDAQAAPWDGGRTAGTLVVVRALAPTPWVEAALAAREAKRAQAGAEGEQRLTGADPGIRGHTVEDLDDAAAVVARLLSAMERLDELERVAAELPGRLADGLARLSAEVGDALGAVRANAEADAAALRGELAELREGVAAAGATAAAARREAEEARRAAEADDRDQLNQVFQQLLGLASARGGGRREGSGTDEATEPSAREPRPGFDDVPRPLARLDLDGRFRELNPAFARLVGYGEREFANAAWPSPHDRREYRGQQEQLHRLAAGEVPSVWIRSTYMHGQGLMVPVVGHLTAVAGDDGRPAHLLLEAEERHTQ